MHMRRTIISGSHQHLVVAPCVAAELVAVAVPPAVGPHQHEEEFRAAVEPVADAR